MPHNSLHDSDRYGAHIVPTLAASQLSWVPFDYAAAWGVPGINDESVVISIAKIDDGEGSSGRMAGGLLCNGNLQAGMSQTSPNPPPINPDEPLPLPDLIGTLSDVRMYSIPYIIPDVIYDLATHFDDASLDGTLLHEYIVFSGILTTPNGYSAPVSGDGIAASFDVLSQGGSSFTITTVLIEREWQTLKQARGYVSGFVKENVQISDTVRATCYEPSVTSKDPMEDLFERPGFNLEEFKNCVLNGPGLVCLVDLADCQEDARIGWENYYADCVRDRDNAEALAKLTRDQLIAFADDFTPDEAIEYAAALGAFGGLCGLAFPPFGPGILGSGGIILGHYIGSSEGRAKLRRQARDQFLLDKVQAKFAFEACYDGIAQSLDVDYQQCSDDFSACIDRNCNFQIPNPGN